MTESSPTMRRRSRGVLVRVADVRVVELSPSGCLLEAAAPIEVATAGKLRLSVEGYELADDIRISRCTRVEGSGSRYRAAAEFLCVQGPSAGSIRRAAQRVQDGEAAVPEQRGGSRQKSVARLSTLG